MCVVQLLPIEPEQQGRMESKKEIKVLDAD